LRNATAELGPSSVGLIHIFGADRVRVTHVRAEKG